MRLTPGYLTAVATFYDMFDTHPKGRHDVYVCTNISCSLRGADELYEAMLSAAGDDPDFHVQSFECLGACDIAPMISLDGEYIGPLVPEDCDQIVADVKAGRPVLEAKQLRHRPAAARRAARRSTTPDRAAGGPSDAQRGRGADGGRRGPSDMRRHEVTGDAATPLRRHRPAGPQHARRLPPRPGRLRDAAARAGAWSRRRCSPSSRSPASAAAAAPASRWARRRPSSPRATWTSTSSATRTSPSRGRSRTAS